MVVWQAILRAEYRVVDRVSVRFRFVSRELLTLGELSGAWQISPAQKPLQRSRWYGFLLGGRQRSQILFRCPHPWDLGASPPGTET